MCIVTSPLLLSPDTWEEALVPHYNETGRAGGRRRSGGWQPRVSLSSLWTPQSSTRRPAQSAWSLLEATPP